MKIQNNSTNIWKKQNILNTENIYTIISPIKNFTKGFNKVAKIIYQSLDKFLV